MVLASTRDDTPIEDLAQLADKIVEVAVPPSVSNVSAPVQTSEIQQLRTEIASLTKVVQSLRKHRRSRSNSFSRRRSPSQAGQPRPPSENSDLCWYHYKFGDSALKCKPPYSKSGNDQASH